MAVKFAIFGLEDGCSFTRYHSLERIELRKEWLRKIEWLSVREPLPAISPPDIIAINGERAFRRICTQNLAPRRITRPMVELPFVSRRHELTNPFLWFDCRKGHIHRFDECSLPLRNGKGLTSDRAGFLHGDEHTQVFESIHCLHIALLTKHLLRSFRAIRRLNPLPAILTLPIIELARISPCHACPMTTEKTLCGKRQILATQ